MSTPKMSMPENVNCLYAKMSMCTKIRINFMNVDYVTITHTYSVISIKFLIWYDFETVPRDYCVLIILDWSTKD